MTKKELEEIANKMFILEQKCQSGEDKEENFKKMEKLASKLSIKEIFEISEIIEKKFS